MIPDPATLQEQEAELERIVRIVVERFDPERIVLFGSRAEGRAAVDSDADLLVVMPTDLPFWERGGAIRKALQRQGLGLDLLVYTPGEVEAQAGDPFSLVHEILRTGKVLHLRPAA